MVLPPTRAFREDIGSGRTVLLLASRETPRAESRCECDICKICGRFRLTATASNVIRKDISLWAIGSDSKA